MRRKAIVPNTCQFPLCGKSYPARSLLDDHHIKPRSMGGGEQSWNLMRVCPDCHRMIHVPGMTHGQHALQHIGSIVVYGYIPTSAGRGVHYKLIEMGREFVWLPEKRENVQLSTPLHAHA